MSAKTHQEVEGQKLKEIFEREKRANKLTRPIFAKKMNFPGGPNLIYQHMEGLRPISLEAALLYAEGLNVKIDEFSPRIAEIARRIAKLADEDKADAKTSMKIEHRKTIQEVIEYAYETLNGLEKAITPALFAKLVMYLYDLSLEEGALPSKNGFERVLRLVA